MKRFLLFAGPSYYPEGGWNDFVGDFDTSLEAKIKANEFVSKDYWAHIFDTEEKSICYYL